MVVSGVLLPGKSRFFSIGLGIIVIIVALVAMAYPVGAAIIIVLLLCIALLVDGISRVIHGMKDKYSKGWSKNFGIGVGIMSIIFGIIVVVYPSWTFVCRDTDRDIFACNQYPDNFCRDNREATKTIDTLTI